MDVAKNIRKKTDIEYCSLIWSMKLPINPPKIFAAELDKNHTPNINPTKCLGDNLLT